ncbi:NAD(P)/FAD-dependent oxidoreductase [Hydrogenophaga sp. A37]|uniref:NAD(P)/FAD-dependent oxidoreductase n=1 Tax=Hydrogenophaga sp. A37 TaxID=1945864 RepID=UPI00098778E2|nr:FAD-dependent oxidoreductase [Hydrogenophaga sp. A37]OOG82898.1 pyridine nucleotide-disulfide oxidoreductase [Hydrogenophaga sp. A37]
MTDTTTPGMVIVGAGHCGGRAAQALREAGWTGSIHLIGMERHLPYERPPLSKELLTGEKTAGACQLRSAQALIDDDVRLHTQRVSALDTTRRCITLANGQVLPYHRLLLATGGSARCLDIPGADLPEVLTLRTVDDALLLSQRLGTGRRLLVVGGGFIGLEVAASARRAGMAVTLVEGARRLLGRAVPADIAAGAQALHQAHGVDLRLGVLPTAIVPRQPGGVRVQLNDGSQVDADTVLVGIGMKPATALARTAGLTVAQGIVVDAALRTSAPEVFAAGDVAEFPGPLSGQPMRQETWFNAETQARVAAHNMVGGHEVVHQPPWFWSDQYDHQLQVCGEPAMGTHTVVRELGGGDRIAFHLDAQERLVGMSAWGLAPRCLKEVKLARLLVERRINARPADLHDLAVKLKALAAGTAVLT